MRRTGATQLAVVLRDSLLRFNRRLRRARPVGELSPGLLSALTSLDLAGALTPRELAEVERVQPPTVTRMVGKLEERGLVGRTPHPTDGRQVILAPTERGRQMLAEHRRARDAWLARRLAGLATEERDILARATEILDRISRDDDEK